MREWPPLKSLEIEFSCLVYVVLVISKDVEDLFVHDLYKLVGFTEQLSTSEELKQGITQILSIIDGMHQQWQNGLELFEDVQQNKHVLSTGCEGIDLLLQGGLREGQLTELVGSSSSGKTQVCLQAASNVADKDTGCVMYLDTCNSFSPKRIACSIDRRLDCTFKEAKEKNLETVMSNILCHSVFDIFSLLDVLHQLEFKLRSQVRSRTGEVRLLIIDLISSLITPILGGSGAHGLFLRDSELQFRSIPMVRRLKLKGAGRSFMSSVGFLLKKLAHEYNLSVPISDLAKSMAGSDCKRFSSVEVKLFTPPVLFKHKIVRPNLINSLVTNHTVGGEGGTTKPALGESWKSIPHVRLLLSCDRGSIICDVSVLKHPWRASGLAEWFMIDQ